GGSRISIALADEEAGRAVPRRLWAGLDADPAGDLVAAVGGDERVPGLLGTGDDLAVPAPEEGVCELAGVLPGAGRALEGRSDARRSDDARVLQQREAHPRR